MSEPFQVIICHTGDLKENESQGIEVVSHLAFTDLEDEIDWSPPQWWVLGKIAGGIVSVVGILKRRIQVGEIILEVGGIGGVATHPDHQQHGFASALLRGAAEFIREDLHIEFGLLFCDHDRITFYSKLGWQVVGAEMTMEIHGEKQVLDWIAMVLLLGERAWPEGTIDLCGAPW
jgi:GNAT superfamily N-acetyltransferase